MHKGYVSTFSGGSKGSLIVQLLCFIEITPQHIRKIRFMSLLIASFNLI
jgi:hypothetical protein